MAASLVLLLSPLAGIIIGSEIFSIVDLATLLAIAGLVLLPWRSISLALVILAFAGRFEFGNATGLLDIAFWSALGLLLVLLLPSDLERGKVNWSSWAMISLIAFLGFVLVSLVPTLGSSYGAEKAFRVVVYAPLFVALAQVFLRIRANLFRFFVAYIMFVDVFAIVSVILSLSASGMAGVLRISPPGGGPITLARLAGFGAIACICLAFFHRHRPLLLANGIGLTLVTFMTGSRAPTVFLILSLIAIPFVLMLNIKAKRQVVAAMTTLALSALLAVPIWNYAIEHEYAFAKRFTLITSQDRGTSVELRESFYGAALTFANDAKGLGNGIGAWSRLYFGDDRIAYPHNLFLEIMVEQGYLALVCFVFFLMFCGKVAVKQIVKANNSSQSLWLAMSAFLCLVYSILIAQTSGDLYDNRYIWLFAGICLATSTLDDNPLATTNDKSFTDQDA